MILVYLHLLDLIFCVCLMIQKGDQKSSSKTQKAVVIIVMLVVRLKSFPDL